jgi:hypothetical protein
MGVRNGSEKRFEAAYTLEIETPHVKWANPLPGGPIHLLAVPTVGEGRTVVELAQRVSLDLTTVSIDPTGDVRPVRRCQHHAAAGRREQVRCRSENSSIEAGHESVEVANPQGSISAGDEHYLVKSTFSQIGWPDHEL